MPYIFRLSGCLKHNNLQNPQNNPLQPSEKEPGNVQTATPLYLLPYANIRIRKREPFKLPCIADNKD